jgi:L-arabinonolactonase
MAEATLALDCRNLHGEGVLWNAADRRVWWTDIHGRRLWWFEPEGGRSGSHVMAERVCCFAPRARGGFILALADRVAFWDPATNAYETVAPFEPDRPETRLNDGRTDRQGRLVAGGMNEATSSADSTVIRVDPDGGVTTLIEGVAVANSTCFAPDGRTMYFTDTPERVIRAYDYDPATGALGAMRRFADLTGEPGAPDGSCVDAEGYVWNAAWEGRRVARIAPDGRIDRVVAVPTLKPTCCAFGGADLATLFVTSSRLGADADALAADPAAGGLFAVRPGVRGLEDAPFAG